MHNPKNLLAERLNRAVLIKRTHPEVLNYTLAIILTTLIVTLKILISWLSGEGTSPFILMLPVVLFTAWFGGVKPGIFSILISSLAIWYFFIPPYYSFEVTNSHRSVFLMVMYVAESLIVVGLVQKKNNAYTSMRERIAQQAIVAAIGQHGLEEKDLSLFMDKVARAISTAVDIKYVKILEILPDGKSLLLRSGTGWKRGVVRKMILDGGLNSQAGYALSSKSPVITTNLAKEKRFKVEDLLIEHRAVSGASVVIPGPLRPYGVLSIHSDKRKVFTKDDVNFIRSIANVLSTTIERQIIRQELELMAKVNSTLISSLDPKETLQGFTELLVPRFADVCEIYLKKSEGSVELVDIHTVSKEKDRILREISREYPPSKNEKRMTARILRSGRPIFVPVITRDYLEHIGTDNRHVEMMSKIHYRSLMALPIKARGKIIGAIGIGTFENGRYFTDRDLLIGKEIANRLAVAVDNAILYQEAKSAVSARDEFLSIASHELKTPLTSMLLQLQSVLHGMKSQSLANFSIEKTMQVIESTINQSKRLSRLVNDLLNISLITTGKLELELERTDLNRVVIDVVARLEESAKRAGSSIEVEEAEGVVGKWDKIRIEQAVINLVTNAIKYGEGSDILVKVGKERNRATLSVSDKGVGISKDQQERIFDRFQRGDVKSSIQGLGIGLYLVSEIMKAHGGKISVESKVGKGSTFVITLPL